MIPAPASIEIDALRRALGDRQLGRIGPHITLVPPINLHDDDLTEAMVVVERAAAGTPPFEVTLGPVETFGPASPTRFLRVAPWAPVVSLHDACWVGPLDRPQERAFHPHATIDIHGSPTGGPDPAVGLLAGFTTASAIDRVTLLEQVDDGDGRRWETFVHYPLTA